MKSQRYEAWKSPDGKEISLASPQGILRLRESGLLPGDSTMLYAINAESPEEASAIHHLRMGWEPFKPLGDAAPCPSCGAMYYPKGSGWCWKCGETR